MQPQSSTNPSSPPTYQNIIPWWHDLPPAMISELALPDATSIPSHSVDVVVIGAGVAGLSAALSARTAGAQVIVLEKEAWSGYGATGRNAGILSAGINMSLSDLPLESPGYALWSETNQTLLSLIEDAAQPGSLLHAHLTGAISLAESKNAARLLAREAQARVAAGLNADLWTPEQVSSLTEGRLNTTSVLSALWLPDEGRIQPLTLLAHLARQARRSGVIIAGNTQVTGYQEVNSDQQHYWKITLANGSTLKTQALIDAVGPTTQPNARIYALAFAADLPDTFPLFWDASPYTYADFRPGNGRLGVSGGRYGKAGITRHDTRYHQHLADAARRWLPELLHAQPYAAWAVDLQVTADMVPTLRSLGDVAPGFSIEGLGALGVLPGIVLGRRAGALTTRT
ncbi:MAG: FAD-binding oxidoreductase [Ktedonobacteraceae bacterium]|nr:FAD-binding oxidoreductase [Ktedonobacteraceae bacterium]